MCKVTPRHILEAVVEEYRAELALEKAEHDRERESKAAEAAKASAAKPRAAGRVKQRPDNRVARCRAYLKTLPPSVEGQEGSKRIYQAARIVWADFAIDEAEGYPLLEEYNAGSVPPWEEDGKQGLRRKWDEAVAAGGERGSKLKDRDDWKPDPRPVVGSGRTASSPEPTDGGSGETLPPATLPEIIHNERQYATVEDEAAQALIRANDPPTVFVGNGCGLVDLVRGQPDEPLTARELTPAAMRCVFGRVARWYKQVEKKKETILVADFPPQPLLTSFPARGDWPGVPHLRSIVSTPSNMSSAF